MNTIKTTIKSIAERFGFKIIRIPKTNNFSVIKHIFNRFGVEIIPIPKIQSISMTKEYEPIRLA